MRNRAQVDWVPGQLVCRHLRVDDGVSLNIGRFGAMYLTPAAAQVCQHGSDRVIGDGDLHLVDRLQQGNSRLIGCLSEGDRPCRLKGHIRGID
jgi:hypothetical protein